MLENPAAVVDALIVELRTGRRNPGDVAGLRDLGLWDAESLEQVVQELHACRRAGRISEQDLDALCLMLGPSARATPDDLDATVELEASRPRLAQAPPAVPPAKQVELRRGSVLRDRYVLDEPIGSGGMSVIFRARDLRREAGDADDPAVKAIKVLRQETRASGTAKARLKREFRQTQALRHPGTVRMFDLDCDDDETWFITMELLVGTSLDARLKQLPAAPIDVAEAMRIVAACADVLAFAHGHGVVHGDFKPGNVFLENGGGVRVLDFGAAASVPAPSAADVAPDRGPVPRAASRAYASPELLAGEVAEPRDDIFSLACVVYELLSGRHPFGRLPANKARDLSLAATPLSQLSAAQNAALASGLARARGERPATVEAFMRGLAPPVIEPVVPPVEPPAPAGRVQRRWLAALTATLLLLLVLWSMFGRGVLDRDARPAEPTPAVPNVRSSAPAQPTTPAPRDVVTAPLGTATPGESTADAQAEPAAEVPAAAVAPPLPAATPTAPPATVARSRAVRPREPAQVGADSASIVVREGTHAAVVLLRRQGDLATPMQVGWRLSNGSANLGEDFEGPATGTTRFLPGQTTRAVYVPVIDDARAEGEEFFSLRLSSRPGVVGPSSDVTITIVDDDR